MFTKQCLKQRFYENTKVLVLGTMPGDVSLEQQQYYAHPRNLFWTVIAEHFNNGIKLAEDERYDFLAKHHIGLWDVLKDCHRKGSLDKDIKEMTFNNFSNIYESCPRLQRIFLNGKKAYQLFIKKYPELGDICESMPSTSPANTQNREEKLEQWQKIREFL